MSQPRKTSFQPLAVERINSMKDMPLASFWRRFIAFYIDIFFVIIIIALAELPFALEEGKRGQHVNVQINPFHGWDILALVLYFGIGTYIGHGQTLGKHLLKIRVVSLVHDRLSFWHSVERSLGYGASILEGGFGFIQYFIHPNRQTVHDRIAETIVVSAGHSQGVTTRARES